jgi:outer membrane murein-binding lipoprotein Lpp
LLFQHQKTGELVVKPRYSPRVKLFIAGVIVVVLLVTGGVIYNHGLSMAGYQRLSASRQQQDLQNQVARLQAENQSLREALARAERALQMDQTAYQDLDRSLKASSREIVQLREELNFYRNIISPPNKQSGLRIQSLKLESAANAKNTYRYKMVLIQALKHDRKIRGKARFEISGLRAGETTVLRFPQPTDKPIDFNFKYFQDLEGQFKLPVDFEPQWVKVNVTSRGRNAQTVEQTYPWPRA